MSEVAHTPGPWQKAEFAMQSPAQRGWYAVQHVFGQEPFEGILESEWGVYPPPGESGPVCIAAGEDNARLIAAAPDGLDVAQAIEHALTEGFSGGAVLDENSPLRAALRAFIAKATGERP